MARTRGGDLRAVLAGAIICWAVADGGAIAQEGAEVTEDLGSSYLLARRTTSQGSIIETLLYAGQAIVTEIAVPAPDAGIAAGTTGAAAVTRTGGANAVRADANLPPGMGAGFGGTLLTGEIVDDYLVLHRTRANGPVAHEIFHDGRKVGFVTEAGPSIGTRRLPGRNSFAFEATDDRLVVHLTQPDGTRIHATTEHGRFSGQVIERAAALAVPPRSIVAVPAEPLLETVRPSIGRAPEPQRLAKPQQPAGSLMVEEPAPRIVVPPLPEAVPLPRASPMIRPRPATMAAPVQTGSPSSSGNYDGMQIPSTKPRPVGASASAPPPNERQAARPVGPAPPTVAPAVRPKPAVTSANAPPPNEREAARPAGPAPPTVAPAVRPKPAVTSANAPPPAAAPSVAPAARPKPAVAAVAAQPAVPTAAKPIGPASSTTAAPAAKPKPVTENARPSPDPAAKPVTTIAKPIRSPPSGALNQ